MGDEPPSEFGSLLRRLRVTAGLSQEALAHRAGLSADAIAALERGRRSRPRAFTLGVLADALALGPSDRARLVSAACGSLTSFIGRHYELAEVERMLGQARLLTLLGPGGTGKTRLALAAAERRPSAWWFAALDVCPGPELVTRAVAGAVGAREVPTPWSGYAVCWTAYRWRSSWRRPGAGC